MGGPTAGSQLSYARIRSSPAAVAYASRAEVSPSSIGKRAAMSGWTGTAYTSPASVRSKACWRRTCSRPRYGSRRPSYSLESQPE